MMKNNKNLVYRFKIEMQIVFEISNLTKNIYNYFE